MMTRRTVLRGLGTAVALPFLESALPIRALASQKTVAAPVRMAFVFVPNGMSMDQWRPSATGVLSELPTLLKPLERVRGSVTMLSGLAQHGADNQGDGPGDHARSAAAWLTGVHPLKTAGANIHNGISVDQVAAQKLGHLTRFRSFELGCEPGGQSGDCDSGYSCAYSSNIAWAGESTPIAKEINPRLVFERLMGDGTNHPEALSRRAAYQRSVLDFVLEEAKSLQQTLSGRDRQKIDEYLTSVREIEQRMERFESASAEAKRAGIQEPAGIPGDFGEHIRLMGDMMILAFQSDQTRVATMMIANEGSNRSYPVIGVREGHHEMSHHGSDPHKLEMKRRIDEFHIRQLAYMLERMQSIDEGGTSLLDQTMLVFGAGISDGNRHNHNDLPILLAGKGGGWLKGGRHYQYADQTPMANLFLSMLGRMGLNIEKLGDSTGRLRELL